MSAKGGEWSTDYAIFFEDLVPTVAAPFCDLEYFTDVFNTPGMVP